MTMHIAHVPAAFFDDHQERGLGEDIHECGRDRRGVVEIQGPTAALCDLLNDAEHYAFGGLDEAPRQIVASAKRMVPAIRKVITDQAYAEWKRSA